MCTKNKNKRVHSILSVLLAFLLIVTSINVNPNIAYAAKKKAIKLNYTEYTLAKGKTVKLKASTTKNASVVWKSNNNSIATVSSKGTVKALKDGVTTITATIKGTKIKATCKVKVSTPKKDKKIGITSINLVSNVEVVVGKTCKLEASVFPENATNKGLLWTSIDESIATVNKYGEVTAHKAGTTKIVVTAATSKVNAECTLTVVNKQTTQEYTSTPTPSPTPSNDNSGVATTVGKLNTLLARTESGTVTLDTNEAGNLTIDNGTYSNVDLVVKAPHATITNKATFKSIKIEKIHTDTWIEEATGNTLDISAVDAHVIVNSGTVNKVIVSGVSRNVNIECNATINSIEITTPANVSIEGANKAIIPIDVKAAESTIKTDIPVNLNAEKNFTLEVQAAATNSMVNIANNSVNTTIKGVGVVPVKNMETNTVTNVAAEAVPPTTNSTETVQKATISGQVNKVVDYNTGSIDVVKSAAVYLIPYTNATQNNVEDAIQAAQSHNTCYATNTDNFGNFEVQLPINYNYALIIKADGLQNYLKTIILTDDTSCRNMQITMVEQSERKGTLKGVLTDAFTGHRVVEGITLNLRTGSGNLSGNPIMTTKTNSQGEYEFADLNLGTYTLEIVDTRATDETYITKVVDIKMLAVTYQHDETISKRIENNQVRFVLRWGKQEDGDMIPSDLDSHLLGPVTPGYDEEEVAPAGKFHTYFVDMNYGNYADLDLDDVDYEGPETTTIYQKQDGEYHFYVYDYSNQEKRDNTKLSTSKATVTVYRGALVLAEYSVPTDKIGTLWDVCTYDYNTNTITPINTISFHEGDSDNVGFNPIGIAQTNITNTLNDLNKGVVLESYEIIDNAKAVLANETDIAKLNDCVTELKTFVKNVNDSISILGKNDNSTIYYNAVTEKQIGDKTVNILRLVTADGTIPTNLISDGKVYIRKSSYRTTATITLEDSDISDYQKVLVVSNSATKATCKYYIQCEQYNSEKSYSEDINVTKED